MKDDLIPLRDILKEIEFLHSIRDRSTFEAFKSNSADVRAASYSIMVISEAVRRIPDDWLAAYPGTPWHAIRTIGNKLRHEYQRVSDVILWGIISSQADQLKATIEDMLAKHQKA
ncbi:MAG: DUF86 domain-containing protein [Hyphomicrobiaceae bacterium]|nr:MAG: DUF86 domain-containing protein [Hyphomicrobiaceae bacterium]